VLIIEVVPWLYAAANKIRRLAAAAAAEGDGAGHRWQAHRPVTSLIGSLPCWRVVGADGRIIRCCWLHVMGSWEVIQWSPNWRLGLLYGVVKRCICAWEALVFLRWVTLRSQRIEAVTEWISVQFVWWCTAGLPSFSATRSSMQILYHFVDTYFIITWDVWWLVIVNRTWFGL